MNKKLLPLVLFAHGYLYSRALITRTHNVQRPASRNASSTHAPSSQAVFHVGVKMIIKNKDGLVLILKSTKALQHGWDLPGGLVQQGEDHMITAIRDTTEQTGIATITKIRHLGMSPSNAHVRMGGNTVEIIVSIFTGITEDNASIVLSPDYQNYAWVTPEKALLLLGNGYEKFLRE